MLTENNGKELTDTSLTDTFTKTFPTIPIDRSIGDNSYNQQVVGCQLQLDDLSTYSTELLNETSPKERLYMATSGLSDMLYLAKEMTGCKDVQYLTSQAQNVNNKHDTPDTPNSNSGINKSSDCPIDDYYTQIIIGEKCIGYLKFSGMPSSAYPIKPLCDALTRQFALTMNLYLRIFRLSRIANNLYRSRQVLLAADDARRRDIAEVLHGTMQVRMLTAWQRLLDAQKYFTSDPERALENIRWVSDELDSLRENDLRGLARKLHPNITVFGMLASIRALVKQLSSTEDALSISMFVDKDIELIDYPGKSQIDNQIRLSAYRFVEETAINAIRHGKATEIRIEVHMTSNNYIKLSVVDNGDSFDVEKVVSGVGFASIDARIGQVGGHWRIESSQGSGTTVTAMIPLSIALDDIDERHEKSTKKWPTKKATNIHAGTKTGKSTDEMTYQNISSGNVNDTTRKKGATR
jgi:signal transduction histidine kinase